MANTLAELRKGEKARIVAFKPGGAPCYRQKLLAMGLVPGTSIVVNQIAPLGDPFELSVHDGTRVSVRKKEGCILLVERTS